MIKSAIVEETRTGGHRWKIFYSDGSSESSFTINGKFSRSDAEKYLGQMLDLIRSPLRECPGCGRMISIHARLCGHCEIEHSRAKRNVREWSLAGSAAGEKNIDYT